MTQFLCIQVRYKLKNVWKVVRKHTLFPGYWEAVSDIRSTSLVSENVKWKEMNAFYHKMCLCYRKRQNNRTELLSYMFFMYVKKG
jgi:hypothetical protein